MMDFGLRMKSLDYTSETMSPVKVFYFANLNSDEAAVMTVGHHSLMDGISLMQALYSFSDNIKIGDYPFIQTQAPSFATNLFLYLISIYSLIQSGFFFMKKSN